MSDDFIQKQFGTNVFGLMRVLREAVKIMLSKKAPRLCESPAWAGAIKTEFYGRSRAFMKPDYTNNYNTFVKQVEKANMGAGDKGASAESAAK